MCHLFLDHPDNTRVYGIEDQYLLGDDLLVASILHEGSARLLDLGEGVTFTLTVVVTDRIIPEGKQSRGPPRFSCWVSRNDYLSPADIRQTA